jgi:hypothetical protein
MLLRNGSSSSSKKWKAMMQEKRREEEGGASCDSYGVTKTVKAKMYTEVGFAASLFFPALFFSFLFSSFICVCGEVGIWESPTSRNRSATVVVLSVV